MKKTILTFMSLGFCSTVALGQTVELSNLNDWNTGYRAEYTVTNDTSRASESWVVVLQLTPNAEIQALSNASIVASLTDTSAGVYAFTNESYNGVLNVNGSANFGFNLDPDNGTAPPENGNVTLDFNPNDLPKFLIENQTILEGDSGVKNLAVTVKLSGAYTEDATVDYATADGSATAGEDYQSASGTLTFEAGETEKIVNLSILSDLIDEGDESFTLALSNASGLAISSPTSTITIQENDVVPDIAIANSSIFENAGTPLQFFVTLTPASSDTVRVNYATTNRGSATVNTDFEATSGTLTFAPGETIKTIQVPVIDDEDEELPETVEISLSSVTNADLSNSLASGTIIDNELGGNGKPQTGEHSYAEVLQKSLYFYETQRSGKLPENNRVSWRADSALEDGADVGLDLTGGWYDAGDHVKFNFPMASSATILAWGGLEFPTGYQETGQYVHLLDNLRWVCDYFIKCHIQDAQGKTLELYGQVGGGTIDHSWWGPVEVYFLERPSFKVDRENPGSDLAAETAAALASASMLFRAVDPAYADELLDNARKLYDFADTYRGKYSDAIPDVVPFYNSWSGYNDELLWGALWMYKATNEQAYLDSAIEMYNNTFGGPPQNSPNLAWTCNWDDKNFGSLVLLSEILGEEQYLERVRGWLDFWLPNGEGIAYSPGGQAWLSEWGSLRYSSNTALLALIYAQNVEDPNNQYTEFATNQINYALGSNPQNRSYVCGYGENFPLRPHHRGAHGNWNNNINDPEPNRHVLTGALVGGPSTPDDFYEDDRSDFQANEITTDYNAGFTGALARLYELHGGFIDPGFPMDEVPEPEIYVSAALTQQSTSFTEIRAWMNNKSAWPARHGENLQARFFLDLSELYENGFDVSDVTVSANIVEDGVLITEMQPWDTENHIYYTEIDFTGTDIVPGGSTSWRREAQIRWSVPVAAGAYWDISNDPSLKGLPSGPTVDLNTAVATGVATYQDSVLLEGLEPGSGESASPIALWNFNEGQGTVVRDATGNGYDGAASNATWVAGGLDFNGRNSSVNIPAELFSGVRNEISVAMWILGDDLQPRHDSLFYAVNAAGLRVLNIHLPWKNSRVYWDAGGERIDTPALPETYRGDWNHWVFTKNAISGEMAIYVNGELLHSGTGNTNPIEGITTVRVGSAFNNLFYDGTIDSFAIYNEALSAAEIGELYAVESSIKPVAQWDFNEAQGTVAVDSTGNGHDGIVRNGTWVDGALDFNGSNTSVDIPVDLFNGISNEISVGMWILGDNAQPRSDSLFYAENAAGVRILNIHLPWKNSRVYWDAGRERIDTAALPETYRGAWNHWVFTKNASTGEMAIYVNGELLHSGTGNTNPIEAITTARVGSSINNFFYDGTIDKFAIYNTALSAEEVTQLYEITLNE